MLIVFDLDFTLWDCGGTWCDHTNPPYYRENGIIRDKDGRKISLYPDVKKILQLLNDQQITLAVASRTYTPDWADELMQLFDIRKYFNHFEIYPGSKVNHFHSLNTKTGFNFHEMIFFDDEYRNVDEVANLGVKSIFVDKGISLTLVESSLRTLP